MYQWGPDAFLYLQIWNESTGTNQLVAFDESGDIRTLYPTAHDRFFAGPGMAVATSIESRVEFQRGAGGTITALTWQRDGAPPRTARRAAIERHEDVRFPSGDLRMAGTLISPATGGKHPAIVLVHGSGAQSRENILPFARFLIRHGVAVLGYDKRGVGGSTGDWNTASFDDLAGDAVAAFEYLKTRSDIDSGRIGLLGVSQAGWIMPLAAVRASGLAFLISISGAAVPAAETTIDHARARDGGVGHAAAAGGAGDCALEAAVSVRANGAGMGRVHRRPSAAVGADGTKRHVPGTPDHPQFQFIRRLYFYDPAPTLRQLQMPTLALFGELDNNILAGKNKAAWESAFKAGVNRDYTLEILPKGNHIQLEAKVGNNAEMASLQRFVPAYFTVIRNWLGKRIPLRS